MIPVVVGLSGGVDSFVTALLLRESGYRVVGVQLILQDGGEDPALGRLCRHLGIELIAFDGRAVFDAQVVTPFVEGYLRGMTPNPCAVCNSRVKWALLKAVADERGITAIATGHYVRIHRAADGLFYVRKGVDAAKDQSYFLWGLKQDVLSRAVTPLGEYTKQEVRHLAETAGYPELVRKKESMGVCFLAGRNYRDFIRRRSGLERWAESGEITDGTGKRIGHHTGILNYTVGQKQGIPLCEGKQLYVSSVDVARNVVRVDEKEALRRTSFEVEAFHFVLAEDMYADDVEVKVRGIGLNPEGVAALHATDGSLLVRLSSPAWAVAPGQPVVFYRKELLLGGGIIKKEQLI